MIILEQKKQTNIAEYVILMYQIEDMVRAYKFDISLIEKQIIAPQAPSQSIHNEMKNWYLGLIKEMKSRGLENKGHAYELNEVMAELVYLHMTLHDAVKDIKYTTLFNSAKEHIEAFRKKSDLGEIHPVEVCFQALYMKLLMKLQKKEISAATEEAFDAMRILVAYIGKAYHQMKSGDMSMFESK